MLHAFRELSVPEELAKSCVGMTAPCWQQDADSSESLERAYARLFGRPMPAALIIAAVLHEGRLCTAHVIPGGVVCLWDPARRWQIRKLTEAGRRAHDQVQNLASELDRLTTRSPAMPEKNIAPLALVHGGQTTFTGLGRAGGDWLRTVLS